MDYSEAANYLLHLRRFRTKLGTDSTRRFLEELGNPDAGTDFVQIAGSNGKGSTARMLAKVLQEQGLRVGLYTSPHLEDFRERIQVDGRKIPKSAITEFVETTREFIDRGAALDEPLTHFEVLTGLAIWYFDRQDVDVGILEVGIGGRYDATSVVSPVASAVTNVSLEHTDIIGSTLEEIAEDKVHVAPEDGPLVTAAHEVYDTLREATDIVTVGEAGDDVVVEQVGRRNHVEQEITITGPDWDVRAQIPHLGRHQAENAGIAATLARQVTDIGPETIGRGLRKADWPGRFEIMGYDPVVVLDGAHNPGATEELAKAMTELSYEDLHLVFGAMHDKDLGAMIAALPEPDHVFTCHPDEERAEDEHVLARAFEERNYDDVEACHSVASALDRALDRAGPEDSVLVTGSLYTVSEARQQWTRTVIPKDRRLAREADGTSPVAELDGPQIPAEVDQRRHVTLKTRLPRHRARTLQTEMLRAGGDCAVSALVAEARFVDVVLSGTRAHFEDLVDRLESDHDNCPDLGPALRQALDPAPTTIPGVDPDRTPAMMGILNVTPDSFHDGGEFDTVDAALAQAQQLIDDGADILDIGGESTRPGADPVSTQTEIDRVVPVIEALQEADVAVSIDTRKAPVAEAAIDAGADMVNDVSGLDDPDMRYLVAERDVPVVLMHSVNTPVDPEYPITYDDVVEDVIEDLKARVLLAQQAGIDRENIIVDPGIGFGKSAAENFALLDRLHELSGLGLPILFGHSHKSFLGSLGYEDGDRLEATVAATAMAADRGAAIIRVHDVAENLAAVETAIATRESDSRLD